MMETPPISSEPSPAPSASSTATLYAEQEEASLYGESTPRSNRFYSPAVRSTSTFHEFDNRQTHSESSVSVATLVNAPKKRAVESPTMRSRGLHKGLGEKLTDGLTRDYFARSSQKDGASLPPRPKGRQTFKDPRFTDPREETPVHPSDLSQSSFWNSSEDTPEMMSNKRIKNNIPDRKPRTGSDILKKPRLKRQSTGTWMGNLTSNLTISCSEEKEETPNYYMDDSLSPGVKSETRSRRPLQDISIIAAETDVSVSCSPRGRDVLRMGLRVGMGERE